MKVEIKRACLVLIAGILLLAMMGCQKKKKDYDVYFFNGKSEIAENLTKVAQKYEEETGKKVKVFTVGTTESAETLRSEMKSKDYPTVYASNAVGFEEWKSAGYAVGVEGIQTPELRALYESIPDTMKLQFDGNGNYGIPYNMEGYGLIANKQMVMDILGISDVAAFVSDYKDASYEEFQQMIMAMDIYIQTGESTKFILNKVTYQTSNSKTSLTSSLNGVLAIAGAEKWTYGNHFGNYPISAVYEDIYDVRGAKAKKAKLLKNPLIKSLEELEFLSSYNAGPEQATKRGPQFVNSTVTGYDQAVQTFAEGKAVFIKNGNWIYGNVAKISADTAKHLMMLPMKVNLEDSDIQVEGLTVDKMNRSIPEFVSQYYIINSKATEKERKEAEKFVLWLNTSHTGQDFIVNEFAFVPFNADENTKLDNPLSNDLIQYKLEDNLLANPFDAAPASWGTECYGKYIMEDLFTEDGKWSEKQLETIANQCIKYWQSGMDEW